MNQADKPAPEREHWLNCPKLIGGGGECHCDKIDAALACRWQERERVTVEESEGESER